MNFADSLSMASIGEYAVWTYLNQLTSVKSLWDVREDYRFQLMDVDFLVMDAKRQVLWLEVKTDYHSQDTGNFVYEVSTSGNIGCFEKTKADTIAYYVPYSRNLYFLNVLALRNYVKTHELKKIRMGDNAEGYLLDIGDLERTDVILFRTEVNI